MNRWYCLLEKEPVGVIYAIRCMVNGKFYIGQTIDPIKRRSRHFRNQSSPKLKNAMAKYGLNRFVWGIIEYCSSLEQMNEKEIEYIEKFDSVENGYNLTYGGTDRCGYSEELREKHRQRATEQMKDPEARANISRKLKGQELSADTRLRMSLAHTGKSMSEESKQLMSKYQRGRLRSGRELDEAKERLISARANYFNSIRYEVVNPAGEMSLVTREFLKDELPKLIGKSHKQILRAMYHGQKINQWTVKHKCRKRQT